MNRQVELENDLVRLRPIRKTDFEELFAVASDPLIWEQHKASDRYKEKIFQKFFDDAIDSEVALAIFDKKTGEMIGSSRFNLTPKTDRAIEIGWTFLSRKYWGGAYNRSFKFLMMDHAFKYVEDVVYYVAGDNERSKSAVRKLGGVEIDATVNPELVKDAPNYTCFRIQKSNWLEHSK